MKLLSSAQVGPAVQRVPLGRDPVLRRNRVDEPGVFSTSDYSDAIASACLHCPDQSCWRFSEVEAPRAVRSAVVCPVDAISMESTGEPRISSECIGCGLCVARCPYGSLFIADDGRPRSIDPGEGDFQTIDRDGFIAWSTSLDREPRPVAARRKAVEDVVDEVRSLTQSAFYPLVANALTATGYPTRVTPQGDTNLRIDAVIMYEDDSIPIEIKSPTESESINVKAIQQALENKVILRARGILPHKQDTSSLAIGYRYPAQRSDVDELIDDVWTAFGISIGTVDLASLLRAVWDDREMTESEPPELRELRGSL